MRKPDFFVVGAPKCGTYAYHNYLQEHPDTYMLTKELHPFGKDFHYINPPISLAEYHQLLQDAPNDKMVGEINVWYLYSQTAAQELYDFQPDAKIVMMLRNPVDLMVSLHGQMVYNGTEFEKDFEKAIMLSTERKNGQQMPQDYYCPTEAFYYDEVPRFYEQAKRYYQLFPKESIHVILLEDIRSQPEQTFIDTLDFLGLRHDYDFDLKEINVRKKVKSEALRELTRKPPSLIRSVAKALIPSSELRQKIKRKLWKLNSEKAPRPEIDPVLRQRLKQDLKEDIEKLQELIGRDLSLWL